MLVPLVGCIALAPAVGEAVRHPGVHAVSVGERVSDLDLG
jgi:hypothetical protein